MAFDAQIPASAPRGGFTLVELLIVVAIIAVLAAIAVPNFLEAQVRARVSRAKADLRSLATALEAYAADEQRYPPNDGVYNVGPSELTTPVAYIARARLVDPFSERERDPVHGNLAQFYSYLKVVSPAEAAQDSAAGRNPPVEAVDAPGYNPGALAKYGRWRAVSNGPDRRYSFADLSASDPILQSADTAYDPTNGTVSRGNLLRTQREAETRFAR